MSRIKILQLANNHFQMWIKSSIICVFSIGLIFTYHVAPTLSNACALILLLLNLPVAYYSQVVRQTLIYYCRYIVWNEPEPDKRKWIGYGFLATSVVGVLHSVLYAKTGIQIVIINSLMCSFANLSLIYGYQGLDLAKDLGKCVKRELPSDVRVLLKGLEQDWNLTVDLNQPEEDLRRN